MAVPFWFGSAWLAVADVADARRRREVLDDEGPALVEDHDPGGLVEDEHLLSAHRVADVEDAAATLIEPFGWTVATRIPSRTSAGGCWRQRVSGFRVATTVVGRRCGLRCRFPRLQRRDPAGQRLVRSLGVVDVVERVDLRLQLGRFSARGCLSR